MNDIQTRIVCFRETLRAETRENNATHHSLWFGFLCDQVSSAWELQDYGVVEILQFCPKRAAELYVSRALWARSARSGENWVRKFS